MLILCIADVERDVGMKNLSPKEAITILEGMRIDIPVPKAAVTQIKRNLALDMAINALNCSEIPNNSDTIIRQQAIDALCKSECGWNNAECRHKDDTDFCVTCDNVKIIKSLPSAQPEQRWIPVAERLPEEYGEYLVTYKSDGEQIFMDIIEYEPSYEFDHEKNRFKGNWLFADDWQAVNSEVIAWMPLPEPYQEGEQK